jgi:hypothetical protein
MQTSQHVDCVDPSGRWGWSCGDPRRLVGATHNVVRVTAAAATLSASSRLRGLMGRVQLAVLEDSHGNNSNAWTRRFWLSRSTFFDFHQWSCRREAELAGHTFAAEHEQERSIVKTRVLELGVTTTPLVTGPPPNPGQCKIARGVTLLPNIPPNSRLRRTAEPEVHGVGNKTSPSGPIATCEGC